MPLTPGSSHAVVGHNIKEMEASGHPHKQAIAASLENAGLSNKQGKDAGWEEGKHPRGQPGNAGEFASGGGSGGTQPKVSVTTQKGKTGSTEKVESAERPKGIGWNLKEAKEQTGKPNSVFERNTKPAGSEFASGSGSKGTTEPSSFSFSKVPHSTPENSPKTNPEWKYKDATGVERTGHVKATHEGQGSDVTYTFQRADGSGVDLVSGSRLKEAKTTGRVIPVGAKPTATDPDSPEQIEKFKNGTESLRDRMSRSAETYKQTKDEQPGMITQPSSGAPAYKGRDLDQDPVGDRSSPDCSVPMGDVGWHGRVL